MNGKLRDVIARVQAAGFRPDFLAEMVRIGQLPGSDRDLVQSVQQSQRRQFANRMRQNIYPDAEGFYRGGAFTQAAVNALPVQHEGKRKPGNSSPRDED